VQSGATNPAAGLAETDISAPPPGATPRAPAEHASSVGDCPPVLIMNLFYTGLGIARDLAGRGVRVIGLSAHPEAFGNFTRFCEVRPAPNSQEQPEALLEFLLRASVELRGSVIFPTRDFDVLFLDRYRVELAPHYRLAIPPHGVLERVLDKQALVLVARQAGVAVPRTMKAGSVEELARVQSEVGFPCVIKPVSSFQWRTTGSWERVGGKKAFLAGDLEELRREYARVANVHPEVLIQEWIPGATDQIGVLGGYASEGGELLAYFTVRKILQSPDDFGTGCIVRSEAIPELLEPTVRLLRALGYQGMAEVEYKFDPRTGEHKLIEINTRHWDQHKLGEASGINLSWVAYGSLTGRKVELQRPAASRVTWIAEDALLLHVLRGFYRHELHFGTLREQLSGPRMYGIFAWNDLRPFVRHTFGVTLPSVARQVWNKIRFKGK
jgi:D-aspartate ligase